MIWMCAYVLVKRVLWYVMMFCCSNFVEGNRSSVSVAMAKSSFKHEHTLGMLFFFVLTPVLSNACICFCLCGVPDYACLYC